MYFQGPPFIPKLLPLSLMSISPIFIFFITIFIFIKLAYYKYILTILTISTIICNANHNMIIHLPHCYCSCSTFIVLLIYAISITSYALYLLLTIIYMKLLLLYVACCSTPCSRVGTPRPTVSLSSSCWCAVVGSLVDFAANTPDPGRSPRSYPSCMCTASSLLSPVSFYCKLIIYTSNYGEAIEYAHQNGTRRNYS